MNISDLKGTVKLSNGVPMPYFGLGVFNSKGQEVINAVKHALKTGYRHIDTAAMYLNEAGVGQAIRESDVPREEIFITTKVWNSDHGYDKTMIAFDQSMDKLRFDYLDLYLIHWPVRGKFKATWKALEELYRQGRVKAIGVSNFLQHHLIDLYNICEIEPMVNQMEFHPYLVQQHLLDFCKQHAIQYEAWSPILKGKVMDIQLLKSMGEKYMKSPVQIVLRWDLQKGVVTIPKSSNLDRIETNTHIFDFELSDEEMAKIDALDKNQRFGPHPDHINF